MASTLAPVRSTKTAVIVIMALAGVAAFSPTAHAGESQCTPGEEGVGTALGMYGGSARVWNCGGVYYFTHDGETTVTAWTGVESVSLTA